MPLRAPFARLCRCTPLVALLLAVSCGTADEAALSCPAATGPERPAFRAVEAAGTPGVCLTRLSDHVGHHEAMAVHAGSRHQAFNADESVLLFRHGQVMRLADSALIAQLPEADSLWVWSPSARTRAFAARGAQVITHDFASGRTETLIDLGDRFERMLTETTVGEPSDDGRFWVIAAERRVVDGGGKAVLQLDLTGRTVRSTTEIPADAIGSIPSPRWLAARPDGDGFLVGWPPPGGAPSDVFGVEHYDRAGRRVQRLADDLVTGDVALDAARRPFFVFVRRSDAGGALLVKAPLDRPGAPPEPLLDVGDAPQPQVTCLAHGRGFCVLATTPDPGPDGPPPPGDILRVDLDSRPDAPKRTLLARHRSDPAGIYRHAEESCPLPPSVVLPNPSLDRGGRRLLFGSNWGDNCFAEVYMIGLP